MSRFGSDPRAFFNSVYQLNAPWDVGKPQPALMNLLAEVPPLDPILDVGCGSGDLAIYLAQLGHQVVGIDFVEAAIAQAREKTSALPSQVASILEFEVADALQPSLLKRQFGSVVDSGFLHLLEPDECDPFVADLARVLLPGGHYYLLAFAIEFQIPHAPRAISEDELRARFTAAKGWLIRDLGPAEFLSRVAAPTPAVRACIERLPAKQD
jgi:ubiquinone/menaquinone biosynthesis C-methylase UbiE